MYVVFNVHVQLLGSLYVVRYYKVSINLRGQFSPSKDCSETEK